MALSVNMPRINAVTMARLLRREAVEQYVYWMRILCICACLLIYGLLVYQVITSYLSAETWTLRIKNDLAELSRAEAFNPPSVKSERQDYSSIVEKAVFGELEQKAAAPAATPAPASNLELSLIGVFVSDSLDSFAIIESRKDKAQEEFKVGQMVFDAARLKSISPDQVEVERNGQVEILRLDETPDRGSSEAAAAAATSEDVAITSAELDKALENLPLLLTQARAVPYFQDGKSVGLRLFAIRSGSLYEKLGLTNGDILKSVNGSGLTDFSQAAELFQKLKEEKSITLVLERNKQDKEIRYQIR